MLKTLLIASLSSLSLLMPSAGKVQPDPAPIMAPIVPKVQKALKTPDLKPQTTLEPVWINKLRPLGTYAGTDTYAWGNCTYYVAERLPIPGNWGNANNWAYSASLAGFNEGTLPKVGSIAQTSGDSFLGHVAIVESVNPDGSFIVSEMNYAGLNIIDNRPTSTAEFPNFIYV